jgi:hypothetical protein
VQVGIDFDDNGVLDSGEVSQTCVVYPLRINIGVDTDRNGVIDTADESGKATNTLTRGALLPPPLRPILATNNSLAGLASIRVDVEPRAAVPGMGLRLVRKAEQSSAELSLINRFGAALPSGYSFKLGNWPTSGIPIYAAPPYARPGAFSPTNHWPKCVTRSGTLESGSLLYETRRSTALPGRLCAPFFLTEASCRVQQ